MWLAIDAVKRGDAGVAVSAGNTGALMAMAQISSAYAARLDGRRLLRGGPRCAANRLCLILGLDWRRRAHLVDLATMGDGMARVLFDLSGPKPISDIGVEEVKGLEEVSEAGGTLRERPAVFDYIGFVEGDDIGEGTADVVVTESYTGNIALEGGGRLAHQDCIIF